MINDQLQGWTKDYASTNNRIDIKLFGILFILLFANTNMGEEIAKAARQVKAFFIKWQKAGPVSA